MMIFLFVKLKQIGSMPLAVGVCEASGSTARSLPVLPRTISTHNSPSYTHCSFLPILPYISLSSRTMSFFKRKEKNLIPPVPEASPRTVSPQPSSYRTTSSSTYVASRDGDLYNNTPPPPSTSNYSRAGSVGDVYSRGQKDINQDRSELFSGLNPERAGSGRFFDERRGPAPERAEPAPGEENEEDVEGIKQSLRFTKQESVNSTRNALRLAREAEETARNTLGRLGDQSGMYDIEQLGIY
jgi:hypothetical protein